MVQRKVGRFLRSTSALKAHVSRPRPGFDHPIVPASPPSTGFDHPIMPASPPSTVRDPQVSNVLTIRKFSGRHGVPCPYQNTSFGAVIDQDNAKADRHGRYASSR